MKNPEADITTVNQEQTVSIRISDTIAGEYESRCPEDIPDELTVAGVHRVSLDVARAIRDDAAYNSDRRAQDVGPYGMPLPTFNAYKALAKQVNKALEGITP